MRVEQEGSSFELLQLCGGYFFFYVLTGLSVKYFLSPSGDGFPGMGGFEYLFYSTLGGQFLCLFVCLWKGWFKLDSKQMITWRTFQFPSEYLYIIPSGICTAVVIPTTTLMYSLPISVMVAMIIMRGAVILIGRVVDMIQIRQGLFKRSIYPEENWAVVFALLAVSVPLLWAPSNGFEFIHSPLAMIVLGSYIVAYAFRIYIMNYFKNTSTPGTKRDNRQFFGVEQISSGVTLFIVTFLLIAIPWDIPQTNELRKALLEPHPSWLSAIIAGMAFGMVAFFSVFIFMFKGRSATFAGLVNRLTSLLAGTMATLLLALFWGGKWPTTAEWFSFLLILTSVYFLTKAEKRRGEEVHLQLIVNSEAIVTPLK